MRSFSLAQLVRERRRVTISFMAGLFVLLLIQIPAVEQSFLGAPDRQMIDLALKLRGDLVRGTADPVLFMDIDDRTLSQLSAQPGSFSAPLGTTPRVLIADLLDFMRTAPPDQAPRAVIVDVDVAQPASDGPAGIARLQTALKAWSESPSAPPLILVRESFPAPSLGMDGHALVMPDTPYDSVVQPAPNIFWATPSVVSDMNGFVREITPYQCVLTSTSGGKMKPLYSAALVAYQFIERDPKALDQASAKHWFTEAADHCKTEPYVTLKHGERIDFHFSLDVTFASRVWPALDPAWPGFKTCHDTDTAIFQRLSAIDIDQAYRAGGDVSHGILCQHVVAIGGTNAASSDFVQTPLNEMNGTAVLANAVRGLQLTHGGLRPIPLIFQILMLMFFSLVMSGTALATAQARARHHHLKQTGQKHKFRHRVEIILLNPIILNGIIALTAHALGVALLLISLNFGIWGFLSAPVFASAITETIQEFADG